MQEIEHRDRNGRPQLSQSNFRVPSSRSAYGSTPGWVEKATKDFLDDAGDTEPGIGIKKLPYTRPQLRETIKRRIMAGSDGGRPGQWSARKAQLVAQAYRRAGGGYRGKPGRAQRSLKKWTSERWTTSDGKPARRKGRMTRYLPAAAWKRLTPAQRRATIAKKLSGDRAGRQFVANTQRAASASKKIRSKTLGPSVEEVSKNPNAPQMFANSSSEEDRIVSTEPLEQPFSPNKEKLNEIGNAPSYGSNPPVKPFIPGNLDIDNREPIEKQNGSLALIEPTIIDGSGDEAGMFIIVPLITKFGQIIEPSNASSHFSKTSDHLGKFKSREDAEQYLEWLKDIEEEISYRDKKKPIISMHPIEKIVELAGDGFESRRQSIKNTIKRIADKYMTEKALGPTLRAANSVQIYDPDAIDADNDGLVQDATPWMRPALPSSPIIAGLRSAKNSNVVSQRAMKEAREFANFVSQHEPELTEMMNGFANKKGSSLYLRGLKNRKKTAESLALKAQRLQHLFDGDLTDSITSMNDPLRYTFESDDVNNYTKDVFDVISALAKKGHRASVTNYWTSGDPYKGVNVMVDHPDGFFYEIQFHTPSSYRLKNKLTPLYEKYRDEKNVKKRQEIYDEMLKLSKGVSIPKDIGKFGEPLSRGSGKADFKPARPGKLIPTPLGLSSGMSSRRIEADKPLPLSEISPDLSDKFPATNTRSGGITTIAKVPERRRISERLSRLLRRNYSRITNDGRENYSTAATKDILKDVLRDDLIKLQDGTFLRMPARESLKDDRKRLLNSLRIVFDTREGSEAVNLPTMHAEPYEPFRSMVDPEIDWSSIYLPTEQDAEDLLREINTLKIGDEPSESERASINDEWKFIRLSTHDKFERSAPDNIPLEDFKFIEDETFISIYEAGMRNASLFLGGIHDGMHLAVGRGFDRHGEYAALLAEISFILQIPELSDKMRNIVASEKLREILGVPFGEAVEEIIPDIENSVYDMPKVFDAIIRRSTYKDVGGMSSRNSTRSIRSASEADIDAISQEYLGSERFSRRLSEVHGIESQIGMRSIRERIPMKEVLQSTQELDDENNDSKYMQNQVWKNLNEELEKRLLTMDGWDDAQKERIKKQVDNLLMNLRAMRDDWQSMGRRERSRILRRERIIDGYESHPEIDMNIDDIIKQAELRIHDDGTLSFKLPPNPILRKLVPGDRNYQDVEVPDRETIQSIFDNLKGKLDTRQWYELFESIYQRVGGIAQLAVFPANGEELPHHSLYLPSYKKRFATKFPGSSDAIQYRYNDIAARILQHYVGPELEKVKRNENPKIGQVADDNDHYIHGYLGLMADPHAWRELGQELDKRFEVPPSVILHDVLGHYANGNTFDRHGEWGNILATIALARDKEFWEKLRQIPELADLTDEDREIFIRGLLADVAANWLQRIGYPVGGSFRLEDIKEKINFYDGPIDELLDKLDPPSTRSQGGMSSTRRIPLTNMTDGQLVNLGLQSVDGVAIRGKMFKPSGMSSRRREMTESEKSRFRPITLAPDEKIKLQPGTMLVYANEDDQIIRTELIGPQVARVRGIPGLKLYTDPNPDNQDEVDARMRQWEIDFGPISSDQRQARGRGSQPDRTAREQGRPRTTNEDPIDRILRETEEARSRRGLSSRTDTSVPVTVSKNGNFLNIKYGDFEFDIRNFEPTDNNWAGAYEKLLSWEGSYYSRTISSALLGLEPPMAHGGKGPKAKLAEAASTGSSKGLSNYDISDFRTAVYNAFVSIQRVRDSQPTIRPLYRGMVVENDSSIVDSVVGDTLSMPLTSFTYVELGAKEFAGGSFNSPESVEGTPILVVLEKGAKAADSPNGNDMFRDGYLDSIDDGDGGLVRVPMESVTQGKFKIVGKKKTVLPAGEGWEIRIQQLDTYVPAGSGMSSRTNPPVPEWAKEADISRPINGARSTSLEKLSDEEIRALATRKGLTKRELDVIYKNIVDARDFIRRSKNEPLSHAPGLSEETAKRMRDSIRVEMAPNGVPMVIAEPFEAVIDEVPDKRDWSKVLAPSLKDMQRLVDAIREARDSDSPILEELSQESKDRVNNAAYNTDPESPFGTIIARILKQLGSTEYRGTSTGAYDSWVGIYLEGLANPKRMQAGQGSDGVHDFFGHFGVGRGFDRHGEWAAALVTDSLIRDHPAFDFLTPDEREQLRREFFVSGAGGALRINQQLNTEYEERFGISRDFATQRYDIPSRTLVDVVDTRTPEERDTAKAFMNIDNIIYGELAPVGTTIQDKYLTMDEILDLLGVPPSTTRSEARSGSQGMASTRSSRNSIPFTKASDELLLSIAGNEAAIKKERSIRNISGMSSRTDAYFIPQKDRLRLTDAQKQRIAELNAEGLTDMQIARELGISKESVIRVRKKGNIPAANRPSKNEERNKKIISMVKQGMTHTQIAKELGIHKQSVMEAVLRHARDTGENYSSFDARDIPRRKKIIELNKLGKTDVEIAREVGLSPHSVGRIRKQEGLTVNFSGRKRLNSPD